MLERVLAIVISILTLGIFILTVLAVQIALHKWLRLADYLAIPTEFIKVQNEIFQINLGGIIIF